MIKKIVHQILFKGKSPADIGRGLARQIKWGSGSPGRPTVLALSRSQFSKDLDELRQRTELNWVTISAVKVKKMPT